jgi:biopolymer transport protein ExbB/TolQ
MNRGLTSDRSLNIFSIHYTAADLQGYEYNTPTIDFYIIHDTVTGGSMEFITSPGNGIFLYLMLIFTAVISAIIAERIYTIMIKRRSNTEELIKEVLICIETGEFDGAIEMCERSEAPLNRIICAGLKEYNNNFNHNEDIARRNTLSEITFSVSPDTHKKEESIKRAMDEIALGILPKLKRGTSYLPMLSRVVLLLGVTGTIFGIMNVLDWDLATLTNSSDSILQGISGSLFTTLLGLIIAIPTVLMHSFISHRAQYMIEDAEEASRIVLNALLKV